MSIFPFPSRVWGKRRMKPEPGNLTFPSINIGVNKKHPEQASGELGTLELVDCFPGSWEAPSRLIQCKAHPCAMCEGYDSISRGGG